MNLLERMIEASKTRILRSLVSYRSQSGDHAVKSLLTQARLFPNWNSDCQRTTDKLQVWIDDEDISTAFQHSIVAEHDQALFDQAISCKPVEFVVGEEYWADHETPNPDFQRFVDHVDTLRARWLDAEIAMIVSPTALTMIESGCSEDFVRSVYRGEQPAPFCGTLRNAKVFCHRHAQCSTPIIYFKPGWTKTNFDRVVWSESLGVTLHHEPYHEIMTDVTHEIDPECISLVGVETWSIGFI